MMSKRLIREMMLAGILIICGIWACADLLHKSFQEESLLGANRLQETATALIEKAHRLKDDLLMQETIQALARAPGVAFACVADKEGKVLSHNRPAEMGKAFQMPYSTEGLWMRPISEGQERWGTLIFSISMAAAHKSWLEQLLLQIVLGGLLWVCIVGRSLAWERQSQKDQAALAEYEALLAEEKDRHARQEEGLQQVQEASMKWLQTAVNYVSQGLVLLDQRQRVAAANRPGAQCLGADDVQSLMGKSWHEIPLLGACGKELEKSLASPGVPVQWSNEADDLRLSFETDKDGLAGMWVIVQE